MEERANGFSFSDILRGIYGGIIGSLCCVLPLAGLAAGIGFIPGVMTAPRYRAYFIGAGLILVLLLTWRRIGRANMDISRKLSILFTTLASFFVVVTLFTYLITPATAALVAKYGPAGQNKAAAGADAAQPAQLRLVTLKISGLTCPSCKDVVEGLVNKVDGVKKSKVDADTGNAKITYDANLTNKGEIVKAIAGEGREKTAYKAKVVSDIKL